MLSWGFLLLQRFRAGSSSLYHLRVDDSWLIPRTFSVMVLWWVRNRAHRVMLCFSTTAETRATVVHAVNWFKPLPLIIYYWQFQSDATRVIYSVSSFTLLFLFLFVYHLVLDFLEHSRGSLQGMGYPLSNSFVLCYTWCHPWCLCHFPVWFLVQDVEFDSIASWSFCRHLHWC